MGQQAFDLEHRFKHHPPAHAGIAERHGDLRGAMLIAAKCVDELVPDCQEKSLAITSLEQAMFWGNAGIARHCNGDRRLHETAGRDRWSAWLIERHLHGPAGPEYLVYRDGQFEWTTVALDATQFARQVDAMAIADEIDEVAAVCEHIFG